MAFKEISALNATPVFTTLVNEGLLTKPIFGLVLAEPSPKLILGGRDTNLYNGDLTFVTVETPVILLQRCPCLCSNTDTI